MGQYISKSALAAEIENLENTYKKCPTRNDYEEGLKEGRLIGYKDALHKINTLEVKEVNLEKEIKDYFDNQPIITRSQGVDYKLIPSGNDIAKHFFELGLKAKGE